MVRVSVSGNRPMTTDQKSDPVLGDAKVFRAARDEAARVAGLLRLPFRDRVWRGASGEFQGSGIGSSIDFQDHRAYIPGDDPRHINWQAYARTGNYTMKLYREEVRPQVDLVFDVSRSMFVGSAKSIRSIELFQFAVISAGQSGASVNTWIANADRHRFIEDASLNTGTWTRAATELQERAAGSLDPPAVDAIPLRPNAMRVLISDLLFPGAPERVVSALGSRSGRGVILAPFSREEAAPLWQGNYEFVDAETRERHLRRVESSLLKRYLDAYENHFAVWKGFATKHGIAMARVAVESSLQQALHYEGVHQGAVEMAG